MDRRFVAVLVALGAFALAPAAPASAQDWAPADEATIHPGVMTFTEGGQCTSNFIVTDGGNVYIGQAAHCSSKDAATQTDGCEGESHPLGTEVEIEGASQPGTLAYNSWIAMQEAGETDDETCEFNDFALVRIHPDDVPNVNPSVPFWGGPDGIGTSVPGETVYTYGNSSLRFGASTLSPKEGKTVAVSPDGWSYDVYTATPGIPGDSGSAFLNEDGQALGVLATVQIAPLAGANGVGDFGKELAYAQTHGMSGAELALGTEPFQPGVLAALGGLGP